MHPVLCDCVIARDSTSANSSHLNAYCRCTSDYMICVLRTATLFHCHGLYYTYCILCSIDCVPSSLYQAAIL